MNKQLFLDGIEEYLNKNYIYDEKDLENKNISNNISNQYLSDHIINFSEAKNEKLLLQELEGYQLYLNYFKIFK